VGQAAKAVVGRKFLVLQIKLLPDADRGAYRGLLGIMPRRLIRSEDTVVVSANHTFTCPAHGKQQVRAQLHNLGDAGGNGENMDKHWEAHETDEFLEIGAYKEMEYRLKSLRALVCDLLKTNQELRSALLDAGIDILGG
jgi:hypothetical protein